MLLCLPAAAGAQETTPQGFDLRAPPIDPESVLITAPAAETTAKPCVPSDQPGEIVVCAPDPMRYRIDSTLDDAIREGRAARDGVPRAPDMAEPCTGVCIGVGRAPYRPILIDLAAIPEPLPAEVAEKVRFALTPEELAEARRAAGLDPATGAAR